jgi:ADP-ribosyl-[dinitrogen reductase] hydrolase
MNHPIQSAFLGLAVGDALGVPVEFRDRDYLKRFPVHDMLAFGTHHQPAGTFSDDASLAFCLAEALINGCDLAEIGHNFQLWMFNGFWAARGQVFDIGIATRQAIERLGRGVKPEFAGGTEEYSNGNGSLMRILPLLFYINDKPIEERYAITKQVSSITHGHARSVIACFYYLEFARHLLKGNDLTYIYSLLKTEITDFLKTKDINPAEIALFDRLLQGDIYTLSEDEIQSSGYVIHTLEASIWCLMTTKNYKDAVLKAVNLGEDTDTTAAVTGGLAGLVYGADGIPESWLTVLAKRENIKELALKFEKGLSIQRSDFIATLHYKTTEEGGRQNPAGSGIWQLIKFPFENGQFGGRQFFYDKDVVLLGEDVIAAIKLLMPDYFEGKLEEGLRFDFYDGPKLSGTGVITEILNQKLQKQ